MQAENRYGRLRWLCRRGMKELDVVLERFLSREASALADGAWPQLEGFLGEEDDRLWDWIQQREEPASEAYRQLLAALHEHD